MRTFLVISAFLSVGAVAPALAQDQGDPNPPAVQDAAPPAKPAVAQESESQTPSSGDTSGPATGTPVEPPTAVQKENPKNVDDSGASSAAAGAPGVEAKAGTQGGKEWLPPEEIQRKKP